jgi:hypothetical protein
MLNVGHRHLHFGDQSARRFVDGGIDWWRLIIRLSGIDGFAQLIRVVVFHRLRVVAFFDSSEWFCLLRFTCLKFAV